MICFSSQSRFTLHGLPILIIRCCGNEPEMRLVHFCSLVYSRICPVTHLPHHAHLRCLAAIDQTLTQSCQ